MKETDWKDARQTADKYITSDWTPAIEGEINLARAYVAQIQLIGEMRESIEELYLALALTDVRALPTYVDSIKRARERSMLAKSIMEAEASQ
jgi:hypothetical protein